MKNKKVNCKAVTAIIAAICLIFVVVTVSIILASNGRNDPTEDDSHETSNQNENYALCDDGKIDILTIPGAVKVKTSEEAFNGIEGDPAESEVFVENVKNGNGVFVYGTAKNINTVSVTDGDRVWYITTFEIDVIDDVKNLLDTSTVKAVSVCCYENGKPDYSLGLLHNHLKLYDETTGLFSLKDASSDVFEINGKEYTLDRFADYYARNQFECDGKTFVYYFGDSVELDKLRP